MRTTTITTVMLACLAFAGQAVGFSGGAGTEGDPYQIANASGLWDMQDTFGSVTCHVLTADIDWATTGTQRYNVGPLDLKVDNASTSPSTASGTIYLFLRR